MQKKIFFAMCMVFFLVLSFSTITFAEPPPSMPSQGAVVAMKNGALYIGKIFPGSAADRAGLRSGDILLSVGNTSLAGMTPRDVSYVLDFDPGSTVTVAIIRNRVTQYVSLTKDYPTTQWQIAWNQDQRALSAQRRASAQQANPGQLMVDQGKITYATSDAEMNTLGTADPVTYERLCQELARMRQQFGVLAQSVDHLADKIQPAISAPVQTQQIVQESAPVQEPQQQQAPRQSPYRAFQYQQYQQYLQQQQSQTRYTGPNAASMSDDELAAAVRDALYSPNATMTTPQTSPISDDELNAEIEAILHPQPSEQAAQNTPE